MQPHLMWTTLPGLGDEGLARAWERVGNLSATGESVLPGLWVACSEPVARTEACVCQVSAATLSLAAATLSLADA
jgi:hypothetical protein